MGYQSLIQRIVYKVSGRSLASSGLYVPSDDQYDYAIGGVPFFSATSDTRPDTEKPVQQRKQQFDNYKDPGEYSLNQWWLRSQSSFVGGAGIIYQDPDTQGTSLNIRYAKSIGIDPFTDPDVIQLLRETNESAVFVSPQSSGGVGMATWDDGTINTSGQVWVAEKNGKITRANVGAADISILGTTTIPTPVMTSYLENYTAPGLAPGFASANYLLAYSDDSTNGGLYKIDTAMTATKIYNRYTSLFGLPVNCMTLSRNQLYINVGAALYALSPTAAAGTAWPASPVASVPGNQTIISITDGPDAIYVAANDDTSGYIYKTTFDSSGLVNGLSQVAVLPDGERINCIAAYVATYLVISTMTGIRVGSFTGSGIVYGPPVVTVPLTSPPTTGVRPGIGISTSGFGKIVFYGTRAYVSTQTLQSQHDGAAGIMAVDLSTIVSDNNTNSETNAYSTWVFNPNTENYITGMAVTKDGRLLYGSTPGSGVGQAGHLWIEHLNRKMASGYLDTGRCRFNTIEPKLFKYFSIKTPTPLLGEVSVAVLDDTGGVTNYITYGPTLDPGTNDIATPTPSGPRNYESLRFTLKRGVTDTTVGGVLDSWQIKALPGTLKQRMITRNLLCFNQEKDKSGQYVSGDTLSLDRLTAVRQMCQRGDTVTLQDLVNNISDQVIIDDYQFTMMAPPGPNGENYGGYLTVIMRTVADSVPPVSLAGSDED